MDTQPSLYSLVLWTLGNSILRTDGSSRRGSRPCAGNLLCGVEPRVTALLEIERRRIHPRQTNGFCPTKQSSKQHCEGNRTYSGSYVLCGLAQSSLKPTWARLMLSGGWFLEAVSGSHDIGPAATRAGSTQQVGGLSTWTRKICDIMASWTRLTSFGPSFYLLSRSRYSRLQKVGIQVCENLCWFSLFSRLWGWGAIMFQLSGWRLL